MFLVCPARTKALEMRAIEEMLEDKEDENAMYIYDNVSYKDTYINKETVKGSQFLSLYLNFLEPVQVVEKHHILSY